MQILFRLETTFCIFHPRLEVWTHTMTQMVYLVAQKLITKNRLYSFLYLVVSLYCCFISHVGHHILQIHKILNLGMIFFRIRQRKRKKIWKPSIECIFALIENEHFFQWCILLLLRCVVYNWIRRRLGKTFKRHWNMVNSNLHIPWSNTSFNNTSYRPSGNHIWNI